MRFERSKSDSGFGILKLRTEVQEEETWRSLMRPNPGQHLEFVDVNGTDFEIRLVNNEVAKDESKPAEHQATGPANPSSAYSEMDEADLLTIMGERSINPPKKYRRGDLIRILQDDDAKVKA